MVVKNHGFNAKHAIQQFCIKTSSTSLHKLGQEIKMWLACAVGRRWWESL